MCPINETEIYKIENQEWIDSLYYIIDKEGKERASQLLNILNDYARKNGVNISNTINTSYCNTISWLDEVMPTGDREMERKIENINRWNAMAMVVAANMQSEGIGGHIASYASCATLYEVGFNHFFKGTRDGVGADMVYFQGHTSPGVYARSFLEGRLSNQQLANFRREMKEGGGLCSYPHPQSMPEYWQFPTVSMGLGAIGAIYQARFSRYLLHHQLINENEPQIWAFCGDGEMDEPESIGALTLAAREGLDNLTLTVNCNLQRLDGPVRGNGSVIQELESLFKGAGWNVIKVLWGSKWDTLFAKDQSGILLKRLGELVDGERQKISISDGAYIRNFVFEKYPETKSLVEHMTDQQLQELDLGGHDAIKVYNAMKQASMHKDQPTVILAQTIKGYGMGDAGEARMVAHQQKKMDYDQMLHFRDRFDIPLDDEAVKSMSLYLPDPNSDIVNYIRDQRKRLGGYLPQRSSNFLPISMPDSKVFSAFAKGLGEKAVATTMIAVKLLTDLLRAPETKDLMIPIVPDESRTFGMEALFREVGIYAPYGQKYEPVDKENFLYYKEAKDGKILEEGITEAGAMSSFIAAGSAYTNHGVNTIPFYIFYSMFGFQRVGDFIWAAADTRCKGFMIGATSGKTTLSGEGLQHQDGSSHFLALTIPTLKAYDPAFAYELAIIFRKGLQQMYVEGKQCFYYLTVTNEKYLMPAMPRGVERGIIDGIYRFKKCRSNKYKINLYGSGAIMTEVLKACEELKNKYGISADIWSITSYKQLYDNARLLEKQNRGKKKRELNTIQKSIGQEEGIHICATDYIKALPLSISKWFVGDFIALGTDGFGLSEDRASLRKYFEVDAQTIVLSVIDCLMQKGISVKEKTK